LAEEVRASKEKEFGIETQKTKDDERSTTSNSLD